MQQKNIFKESTNLKEILKLESDGSFRKAMLLMNVAHKLNEEGKEKECIHILNLTRKEIINAGCNEEKPRWSCKLAGCFSNAGRADKSKEMIIIALKNLRKIKNENSWKYTNYLCYLAYELSNLKENRILVNKILNDAMHSLPDTDKYYAQRKYEILSYLKKFSKNKSIKKKLKFYNNRKIFFGIRLNEPHEDSISSFFSRIFLTSKKIKEITLLVTYDFNEKKMLGFMEDIHELWRKAILLCIVSRLFLNKLDFEKSSRFLNIAQKQARNVEFYWVRDDTFEVIAQIFLELYVKKKKNLFLNNAEQITKKIQDPWKRARTICRLVKTEIHMNKFKNAIRHLNYVYIHLLNNIDYTDRKVMSMLIISEVYKKIEKHKKAHTLQMKAFSFVNSLKEQSRKKFLKEYNTYVSLKNL